MPIQMTIVGLGQIGASIGLALAGRSELLQRTGHDRELRVARQAERMGAVDKVAINLISAVREADLVILALPMDQVRDTLAAIAQDLKDGAVVMDTSPVKEAVAAWAGELLPSGRHYVGLTPVINPAHLQDTEVGLEAARADLFKDGVMAIVAPPRTASGAIELAADLAALLGAAPMFADLAEVDSLMAAVHILPHLVGAALLDVTYNQPGWQEARKLAGRPYADVTGLVSHLEKPAALQSAALLGRENVLRVLDGVIADLEDLRAEIARQDIASLQARFERARQGRETWWQQRSQGNWSAEETRSPVEAPTAGEIFGRFIGFGRRKKKPGDEK